MEKNKGNIKSNFLYQSAYQLLTILFPMLTAPYLSRVIGAEGIGVYSYTYSVVYYFVMFGRMGIQTYANREIAVVRDDQKKLNQTFSDIFLVHIVFSVIAIIAYFLYVDIFVTEYKIIACIQGLYLLGQLFDISWVFFGLEKFKITVVRNATIKVITLIAIFTLIKSTDDLEKYIFILAVGSFFSESIIWVTLPKYVKAVKPSWSGIKRHTVPILGFFIPAVAVSVYKYLSKIMLGSMADAVQVGFYEQSEKIINIAVGFISSLGTVMMPRMSNMIATGESKKSEEMIHTSMKFIMLLSLAMACGIMGISNVFPTVFFGGEFASCNVLLLSLSVSLPFTAFANVIRTQYLIPRHHDKIYITSLIVGAVVDVFVNFLMIPRYGALGAAVGTVSAEVAVCIIQTLYVRKALPIMNYIWESLPYLVAGLLMASIVFIVGDNTSDNIGTLIIQIATGIFSYIILVLIYALVGKDKMVYNYMQKLFKKG